MTRILLPNIHWQSVAYIYNPFKNKSKQQLGLHHWVSDISEYKIALIFAFHIISSKKWFVISFCVLKLSLQLFFLKKTYSVLSFEQFYPYLSLFILSHLRFVRICVTEESHIWRTWVTWILLHIPMKSTYMRKQTTEYGPKSPFFFLFPVNCTLKIKWQTLPLL